MIHKIAGLGFTLPAVLLLSISRVMATQVAIPDLLGTFSCTQHDRSGTTWHFRSINQPFGSFVRADTVFAPQNGQPADYASTYVGYEAGAKHWNIVSVDQDGTYFTRYSSSRDFNGAQWTDRYPADGSSAVVLLDKRGYKFKLTGHDKSGRTFTSNTVCVRV